MWEYLSYTIGRVIQGEGYSSEKDPTYADLYANCNPLASWEHLAKLLYRHHQVAAVEEMRSYLPPRGEQAAWLWRVGTAQPKKENRVYSYYAVGISNF